eukprot:766865-Hanusia_phi.AAC.6
MALGNPLLVLPTLQEFQCFRQIYRGRYGTACCGNKDGHAISAHRLGSYKMLPSASAKRRRWLPSRCR